MKIKTAISLGACRFLFGRVKLTPYNTVNTISAKRIERGAWSIGHRAWGMESDDRQQNFGFRIWEGMEHEVRASELQSHRTTEVGGQRSEV